MNIEEINRVVDHMCSEPARCDMDVVRSHGRRDEHHKTLFQEEHVFPRCGTVGCIAGWTVELNREEFDKQEDKGILRDVGPWPHNEEMNFAAWRLGLSHDEAKRLFTEPKHAGKRVFEDGWPLDLAKEYQQAGTLAERAAIIRKRVDRFIATNGRE